MIDTTVNPWKKAAQVIVDWSQMPVDSSDDVQVEIDHLMRWIHSYPERASVHVYLRRSRFAIRDRMLQNTLQSLGCRVTMKSTSPVSSTFAQTSGTQTMRQDFAPEDQRRSLVLQQIR